MINLRNYTKLLQTIGDSDEQYIVVCDKDGKRIYIQVCYYLSSEKTEEREFGAYENIKDNYPKYVLSMDEFDMSRNGIIHMNIRDFLLNFKNSNDTKYEFCD